MLLIKKERTILFIGFILIFSYGCIFKQTKNNKEQFVGDINLLSLPSYELPAFESDNYHSIAIIKEHDSVITFTVNPSRNKKLAKTYYYKRNYPFVLYVSKDYLFSHNIWRDSLIIEGNIVFVTHTSIYFNYQENMMIEKLADGSLLVKRFFEQNTSREKMLISNRSNWEREIKEQRVIAVKLERHGSVYSCPDRNEDEFCPAWQNNMNHIAPTLFWNLFFLLNGSRY